MTSSDQLRTKAVNRSIPGLTFQLEGQWRGNFWFIQAADTQLGMIDSFENKNPEPNWQAEIDLCRRLVEIANQAEPKPKFVVVCGDLVDATPLKLKPAQIVDFKNVFSQLHPDIKLICICGNHDIGNRPSLADIEEYRRDFGDDYFSFWCGGVKFVVINSQLYVDNSQAKKNCTEQENWLDKILLSGSAERSSIPKSSRSTQTTNQRRDWKHCIAFQHIPPFVESPDEETIFVPNSTTLPFNFPDKSVRKRFLEKLKKAGVSHLFSGHYHRNAGGHDGSLEVIVTSAVGCQLGKDESGFRAVTVMEHEIRHQYFTIKSISDSLKIDVILK